MIKDVFYSICLYITSVIMILVYVVFLKLSGNMFFCEQSKGSLIKDKQGDVRGSLLLVQQYKSDKYFYGRMMDNSENSCDLALYNNSFTSKLNADYSIRVNKEDISMIVSSSSKLDPYIMKSEALRQAQRVAIVRGINIHKINSYIEEVALEKQWPFFELDIVNTTKLNAFLDGVN